MDSYFSSPMENIQWTFRDTMKDGDSELKPVPTSQREDKAGPSEVSQGLQCAAFPTRNSYGYFSSDEEIEYMADVADLTNQLGDLKMTRQEKSISEFQIRHEAEKEFDDWLEKEKKRQEILCLQGDGPVTEMEAEDDSDEEIENARLEREVHPSGLTSVGPLKNAGLDPRDLSRTVTYGKMQAVHELNVTDGIDECCGTSVPVEKAKLGATRRSGTLDATARRATKSIRVKSLSLPRTMPKWTNPRHASGTLRTSAATVVRKSRSIFQVTANFFRPPRDQGDSIRHQKEPVAQTANVRPPQRKIMRTLGAVLRINQKRNETESTYRC